MLGDPVELGKLLKSRRIALGLKQKDLEDNVISSSTISNVELGKGRISQRKLAHLCEKLGWKLEDLPRLLAEARKTKEEAEEELWFTLQTIENDLDCVDPGEAMTRLRSVPAEEESVRAVVRFLQGKAYYRKGNFEKAEAAFQEAIRLCPKPDRTNLMPICLYILGQMAFRQNDPARALEAAEQGLALFDPNGERQFLRYHLLISKVIYLEKLERFTEAIMTLEEDLWPYVSEMETDVLLNMYELHASLLTKQGLPEKAVDYAKKGIDLARRARNMERCFELWTTLGTAYKHLGKLERAKMCYETALRFEHKVNKKGISAYNYTELGQLFLMEGEAEKAEKHLQKAVRLSTRAKDDFRQFEALLALGKLYHQQGKEKEAVLHLEKAQSIAQQNGFLRQERDAVVWLTKCYENKDVFRYNKYSARLFQISVQLLDRRDQPMRNDFVQWSQRKTAGDPPDV